MKYVFNKPPSYIMLHDLNQYLYDHRERRTPAPTRHFMNNVKCDEDGYTRIRQTRTQTIVEWME